MSSRTLRHLLARRALAASHPHAGSPRIGRVSVHFAAAAASALLAMMPATALAAWPADARINLPVCVAEGEQSEPALVSDGAGGAIIVWRNDFLDGDAIISAQRVDSTGAPLWTENGIRLSFHEGSRRSPRVVSDGAGGAIVVWEDSRSRHGWDIYAQRVGSDGALLWEWGGVPVSVAPGDQMNPTLIADGNGGAIVAWEDRRSAISTDIYAQRATADGRMAWGIDGMPVCIASGDQLLPQLATDGAGGAIIAWIDNRVALTALYAQQVSAAGRPSWSRDGVVVCDDAGSDAHAALVPDGASGAILFWDDGPIFGQRVGRSGGRLWTRDGIQVSGADGVSPEAWFDSAGAIVVWQDLRVADDPGDIFAQRLGLDGGASWDSGGVAVCTATDVQTSPEVAGDDAGGVAIAWEDFRSDGSGDIYVQRLNAAGQPSWSPDGSMVCSASGRQMAPQLVADGDGGIIVVWKDERGEAQHIYAERVSSSGDLGGTAMPVSRERSVPPNAR